MTAGVGGKVVLGGHGRCERWVMGHPGSPRMETQLTVERKSERGANNFREQKGNDQAVGNIVLEGPIDESVKNI